MANTILTPPNESYLEYDPQLEEIYLKKDLYLAELAENKALARENLEVYSIEESDTHFVSPKLLTETINNAFNLYLEQEDPPITQDTAQKIIQVALEDYVTKAELTKFLLPAKTYSDSKLELHIRTADPHKILPEVEDMLLSYPRRSDVYSKDLLYTKTEIDKQSSGYIKKDGTTPFTKPLIGADPLIDSHFATKRYADKILYNHNIEVDPHGFRTMLNNRLASYIKASNVYDKTLTYSRALIDSIIRKLIEEASSDFLEQHLLAYDPHHILDEVKREKYIKLDGSVPFRTPLKGVDAIDPQDLVTLLLVDNKVKEVKESILSLPNLEWITSGPLEASVGFLESDMIVPNKMSLQEVCDAIFYGKRVKIEVPELGSLNNIQKIKVCIQGSLSTIEYAELYQNGELIHSFTVEDFAESSCIYVDSLPITEDTEFIFKVYYTNGSVHNVTGVVKVALPVFVGIIPEPKRGFTVSYDKLMELHMEDSLNNKFYDKEKGMRKLEHTFSFEYKTPYKIILALPADYPNLSKVYNEVQSFSKGAFETIDLIPFKVPGSDKDKMYKLYIYQYGLVGLNSTLNFDFE